MSTYVVKAQLAGGFWHLYVPRIEQHTQARCLGELEMMARDLISITSGESEADIDLTVEFSDNADKNHPLADAGTRSEEKLSRLQC